jgi:hypothetical protein
VDSNFVGGGPSLVLAIFAWVLYMAFDLFDKMFCWSWPLLIKHALMGVRLMIFPGSAFLAANSAGWAVLNTWVNEADEGALTNAGTYGTLAAGVATVAVVFKRLDHESSNRDYFKARFLIFKADYVATDSANGINLPGKFSWLLARMDRLESLSLKAMQAVLTNRGVKYSKYLVEKIGPNAASELAREFSLTCVSSEPSYTQTQRSEISASVHDKALEPGQTPIFRVRLVIADILAWNHYSYVTKRNMRRVVIRHI